MTRVEREAVILLEDHLRIVAGARRAALAELDDPALHGRIAVAINDLPFGLGSGVCVEAATAAVAATKRHLSEPPQ